MKCQGVTAEGQRASVSCCSSQNVSSGSGDGNA